MSLAGGEGGRILRKLTSEKYKENFDVSSENPCREVSSEGHYWHYLH